MSGVTASITSTAETTASYKDNSSQNIKIPWGRLYARLIYLKPIDLHKDCFSLGRSEDCDVMITRAKFPRNRVQNVSKKHFVISRESSGIVYITDLSKNGTFINGKLIGKNNRNILKSDDEIAIGFRDLKVYIYKTMQVEDDNFLPGSLRSKYVVSRRLGHGACGEVRLVFETSTCKTYALKKIKKAVNAISKLHLLNHPQRIENEINILRSLSHPCIVGVNEIINTPENVFIILEYMEGGELTDRILSVDAFPESTVKFLFYQIALAVQYLQNQGITHRDLKPENVLLLTEAPKTLVKVSDFGLSKIVNEDTVMKTICGTPFYVAPEIFDERIKKYDQKVDIWSLGVILFYMLARELPFKADDTEELRRNIMKGSYDMSTEIWQSISADAKDLLKNMLSVDPECRPSIDDVLEHPWIENDTLMQVEVARLLYAARNNNIVQTEDEPPAKRTKLNDCF